MRYLHRKSLQVIFILLFFALAPIVVLYAQGYRIDWDNKEIRETGIYYIRSEPRGAKLYINDKLQRRYSTPGPTKPLLPGEYSIRVSMLGYHDWEKRLLITSGEITEAEHIVLIPKEKETRLLAKKLNVSSFQLSPNQESIAALATNDNQDNSIWLIDTEKDIPPENIIRDQDLDIASLLTNPAIIWSPKDRFILYRGKIGNTYSNFILDTGARDDPINLSTIVAGNLVDLAWYPESDSRLYWMSNGNLRIIDIGRRELKPIFLTGVTDFRTHGNAIFSIVDKRLLPVTDLPETNDTAYPYALIQTSLDGQEQLEFVVLNLSDRNDYEFVDKGGTELTLMNSGTGKIFVVRDQSLLTIGEGNIDAQWTQDGRRLLYRNNNELWVFYDQDDLEQELRDQSSLVTRLSQPILQATWMFDNEHILYTTADGILHLIELDSRSQRNSVDLAEINSPDKRFSYYAAEEKLYSFTQNKAGENHIVEIRLDTDKHPLRH